MTVTRILTGGSISRLKLEQLATHYNANVRIFLATIFCLNIYVRTEEKAQWVKCLLHMHEDMSPHAKHQCKIRNIGMWCEGEGDKWIAGACNPASLIETESLPQK